MRRLGLFAAAGTIALTLSLCAALPARAQWIVFDPNNYVQNVLTAARELRSRSAIRLPRCRTKRRC
ncbi:conjugal transfer/entry exclusion protein [Bradyrhizobium sp. i1.4.4]